MHKVRTDFILRMMYIMGAYCVSIVLLWAKTGMIAILADGVIPVFYCLKCKVLKVIRKVITFNTYFNRANHKVPFFK